MALEGKIQIQSDIVPNLDNPRMPVTDVVYIKGASQTFANLSELVAFHPNKMKKGMSAKVLNYPSIGQVSEYVMNEDPDLLIDSNGDTIITTSNFDQFWNVIDSVQTGQTVVRQYAPDGPGGGQPVFPYTIGTESNWSNVLDYSKGHRWMRIRYDDIDANMDDIFDNWTVPINIGNSFVGGDYIDKRYMRQAVSGSQHTSEGTLTTDKYYIVQTDTLTIDGDLSLNDIGNQGTATSIVLTSGKIFKYAAANDYTFNNSCFVTETIKPPPRIVAGIPNNEPPGWEDTPPSGTNQLWEITAQKSIYGQLKTEWILRKIPEHINYTRYSNSPSPHPDTIAGPNTEVTAMSAEDTALTNAGWLSSYSNQTFIARREDSGGPNLYTNWLVEKISEESGEYVDRVFKLFDIGLDADSPAIAAPTERDPTLEGWNDVPLTETQTQINYVSQARKFFNGELKTSWSQPVPYTGQSTFNDVIVSDLGDNFKTDPAGAITPDEITLQANLYKGVTKLWESGLSITYVWKKVYDDGSVVDESPTTNPGDDFYLLSASGTPGTGGYLQENQRVVVKPGAVTGHAIFRCTQTVTMQDADDLIFVEEFSILDVSDGIDAKSFVISAENNRVIWDDGLSEFSPATIILHAYWSNIVSPVLYWYSWNGSSWDALANGVGGYTIGGNTLSVATATIFTGDTSAEEQRYAVSTHDTSPDSADHISTFSDYLTISKISAAAIGQDGENAVFAILDNEAHTLRISTQTLQPITGETGASGNAITKIEVYDGLTKLEYGVDYTLGLVSSNANIDFAQQADGTDGRVYISSWDADEREAVCTITVTYGVISVLKKFSLTSTLDAPGALILDIDSNKGFVFTPEDKTDKTFTARLYNSELTGDQQQVIRATQDTIANFAAASGSYTFVQYAHIVLTGGSGPLFPVYRYDGGTKTSTGSYTLLISADYYVFRWNVANSWGTSTTDPQRVITQANILTFSNVIAEASQNSVVLRTRLIVVSDVNDGKSYRAWTNNVTKPSSSQDLTAQDPTFPGGDFGSAGNSAVVVGGVSWYLATAAFWVTNTPTYAQDATEDAGVYTWGPVYQLKGEKGDQGFSGNFFHNMYKASASSPAFGAGGSSSSLAQMLTAGWTSKPPLSGVIWKTSRLWTGESVTFNGAGDPSTVPVVGSVWDGPVKISGADGDGGDDGNDGAIGWSPEPGIVAGVNPGEKVIQLVDWIGGTGTKPGNVGKYIAPGGFDAAITNASIVSGTPIELQYNSVTGFVQWKYTSETSGSWRNLFSPNGGFELLAHGNANFQNFTTVSSFIWPQVTSGLLTGIVNDKGYSRLARFRAQSQIKRDSGGSEFVRVNLEWDTNSSFVSPSVLRYHRLRCDGESWQSVDIDSLLNVPAMTTYYARARIFFDGSGSSLQVANEIEWTAYFMN